MFETVKRKAALRAGGGSISSQLGVIHAQKVQAQEDRAHLTLRQDSSRKMSERGIFGLLQCECLTLGTPSFFTKVQLKQLSFLSHLFVQHETSGFSHISTSPLPTERKCQQPLPYFQRKFHLSCAGRGFGKQMVSSSARCSASFTLSYAYAE